jgi:hypothetical protein
MSRRAPKHRPPKAGLCVPLHQWVFMSDASRLPRRRLRFFLRDFRMAEADALLPEGLSLTSYLANRRGYIHLLDLAWHPAYERTGFAVIRTDQILYASAVDNNVQLVNATPSAVGHGVELLVEGGLFIRAGLMLGPRQRLGDFLESAGPFVPLVGATLLRSGRPPRTHNVFWGDVALNQSGVQAVWETEDWTPDVKPRAVARPAVAHEDEPAPNEPA